MGSLTTLVLLTEILDPAVVLAVWALACLGSAGGVVALAWAVQINGDGDPFARRLTPDQAVDLTPNAHLARHAALEPAPWRAAHTARAVLHRGQHHYRRGSWAAPLIDRLGEDTQAVIPAAQLLAAVRELQQRAA
jgi:hypothetical protein